MHLTGLNYQGQPLRQDWPGSQMHAGAWSGDDTEHVLTYIQRMHNRVLRLLNHIYGNKGILAATGICAPARGPAVHAAAMTTSRPAHFAPAGRHP